MIYIAILEIPELTVTSVLPQEVQDWATAAQAEWFTDESDTLTLLEGTRTYYNKHLTRVIVRSDGDIKADMDALIALYLPSWTIQALQAYDASSVPVAFDKTANLKYWPKADYDGTGVDRWPTVDDIRLAKWAGHAAWATN